MNSVLASFFLQMIAILDIWNTKRRKKKTWHYIYISFSSISVSVYGVPRMYYVKLFKARRWFCGLRDMILRIPVYSISHERQSIRFETLELTQDLFSLYICKEWPNEKVLI